MGLLDPRFQAGAIVQDIIYFSHIRFNGLFKLNINTLECSFVREFCKCEAGIEELHTAGFVYGNWVGFLPGRGNMIHLYNYVTEEMRSIKLNRYKNAGRMVCAAYVYKQKLYVIPHFLAPQEFELPFLEIELESFTVSERWDINQAFKKKVNVVGELCILSTAYYDNCIWFVIHKTSKIGRVNLRNDEIDVFDAGIGDLSCISVTSEHIWLSQLGGTIFEWDSKRGIINEYSNEVGRIRGRAVSRVIETSNEIIAVPAFSKCISKKCKKQSEKAFKADYEVMIDIVIDGNPAFDKFIKLKDRWIFFSCNIPGIYEVYIKTGEITYRPFEHEVLFPSDNVKKRLLAAILASQYKENKGYTLEEFCSDVIFASCEKKTILADAMVGSNIFQIL